jgi:hypothetical protein
MPDFAAMNHHPVKPFSCLISLVPVVEPVRELNVVEAGALRRLGMPPAAGALVL